MILRDTIVEYSSSTDWVPWFFGGDDHAGDVCFDEKLLLEDIAWIKRNNARWIHMGDKVNATTFDDKRYEHRNLDPQYQGLEPDKALEALNEDHVERYAPIAHLCEGAIVGNHCRTLQQRHHIDMHFKFLQRLIPDKNWRSTGRHRLDLGYRSFLRVRFVRGKHVSTMLFWLWHGDCTPMMRQTRMSKLARKANDYVGVDLFATGHWHDRLFWGDSSRITATKRGRLKLRTATRYLCMTGTYLKGMMENHDGYQDKCAYPACELGGLRLLINPETGRIKEADVH
ncbi:hypothetical protein LCGC14_1506480 [marine sediment metagenome]|uniref:Calcineurin-like phosphoesterase domain-containing protein n=1 Tax=marine sediment metagenome TaxID=412755 RepID=A0A0F9M3X9_9ZZZZ